MQVHILVTKKLTLFTILSLFVYIRSQNMLILRAHTLLIQALIKWISYSENKSRKVPRLSRYEP